MFIDKENIEDVFPMSDVSKGMIYHTLKESTSYMFHEQVVRFIQIENFSSEVLQRAIALLANKHENLRSVFNMFDFQDQVQIVLKKIEIDLEYIDISPKELGEQKLFLQSWLENDRGTPFDLKKMKPLWKVRIFLLGEDKICFAFIIHHCVSEGWSAASILTEVHNTYLNLLEDPAYVPPRLKCSYKDFVLEQIAEKNNPENHEFWKQELKDCKRLKPGLLDTNVSVLANSGYNTKKFDLGINLLDDLKKMAYTSGISVKNLCFAAYLYTLYFFSDEQDLLVGLLSNNRPAMEDGDKVFGCFLNTLPFRFRMSGLETWKEFTQRVHHKMNVYLRYGRLSFLEIIKSLGYNHDTQNPLFDIQFSYMDFHVYDELLDGDTMKIRSDDILSLSAAVQGIQKDNLLISFVINPRNGFFCDLLYYDAVIRKEDADRLMEVYKKVLHKIAYSTEETASKPALFSDKEKEVTSFLLKREYPLDSLLDVQVSGQALRLKDRPAIVSGDCTVSFEELDVQSGRLANHLVSLGVGRGDYVGIYLDRSADTVIAMLGVLKSGGAYLPLNPRLPSDRLKYILEDSGCSLVISSAGYSSLLPAGVTVADIGIKDREGLFSGQVSAGVRNSEDTAYLIYTSGTTGGPKGVMISHRNVLNLIYGLDEMIYSRYGSGLRLGLVSPFDFDASVQHIYGSLLLGHTLYIVPEDLRGDGQGLAAFYRDHQIAIVDGTPLHLRLLLESDVSLEGSVRHMLIAGEVLPRTLVERFYERYSGAGLSITNLYGPTETCVDSTLFEITKNSLEVYETIPIGRALPNERIVILNEDGQLQGIGVPGEICIGGAGVSKGYLNKASLTRSNFVRSGSDEGEVLYHTGDIGKWLPDGNISYIGRKDDQVKLRGFRIELGEIEQAMLKVFGVAEAVVTFSKDELEQNCLYGFYTTSVKNEAGEIRKQLSKVLPEYMIPQELFEVEEMPLAANGKVDRAALLVRLPGRNKANIKPVNPIEEKLLVIWSEILGKDLDTISVHDEFISLGGHSLRVMQMLTRIHKLFGVKLQLKEVLKEGTIRNIAGMIYRQAKLPFIPIQKAAPGEFYPLTQAQLNIYLFQQKNPGSFLYNMPQFYEFTDIPDPVKLENAFTELIRRHEILRTAILNIDGTPVQKIMPGAGVRFSLEVYEMENGSATEQDVFRAFIRAFDLENPPLLRGGILKSGPLYYLLIDIHHIISDHISNMTLGKEFMKLYHGQDLDEQGIQYKDFSVWYNSGEIKAKLMEQEMFWLNQFDKEPVIPTIGQKDIGKEAGNLIAIRKFFLKEDTVVALNRIAVQEKTTMFTVLFAVFNVLISRITGEHDICIAIPVSGRSHADLQTLVGNFVNICVVRNQVDHDRSFTEFLADVNTQVLNVLDNQQYSVDKLIAKLDKKFKHSFEDLINIVFDLGSPLKDQSASTLLRPSRKVQATTTPYNINLTGIAGRDRVAFTLGYKEALFDEGVIDRMVNYFLHITELIAKNPSAKLKEIKLMQTGVAREADITVAEEGDFNF